MAAAKLSRHDWQGNPKDHDLLLEAMEALDALRGEADRINGHYPIEWWENVPGVLFVISKKRIHVTAKACSAQFSLIQASNAPTDTKWKAMIESKIDRIGQMVEIIFGDLCNETQKKKAAKK